MVAEKPILPLASFLFPRIFQAFRMAIQPSKLAIALAAVTIVCLTGWVMDRSRTVVVAGTYAVATPRSQIRENKEATELDIYLLPEANLRNFIESRKATGDRTGVFRTLFRFGAKEFHNTLYAILSLNIPEVARNVANGIKAVIWAFRWHPLYSIVFFTMAFVALSLAGGVICRIAAQQFTRGERPRLTQAARFALRRLPSLLGGPVGPAALVFVFGAPIMLLGLAGNLPIVGELLTGLFLGLALITACATTIILIGTVAGLGLMSPAVAYEDADSFDAINHSLSYVYTKPWHMGFYTILAIVYGAVCYVFVRFFAFLLLWTTHRFLAAGFLQQNEKLSALWPEPTFTDFFGPAGAMPDTWSLWLAALLIRLWILGVVGLMVSFVISFYFSANTVIYALMRHRVDGTPLDEVYTGPKESSAPPMSSETGADADLSEPGSETNGGPPS